jgi:hypothetical protein
MRRVGKIVRRVPAATWLSEDEAKRLEKYMDERRVNIAMALRDAVALLPLKN